MKHFFLDNIVIYEALGQVILPWGLSALRQYHLPSGFIHDIDLKEVFYSVNIESKSTKDKLIILIGIYMLQ